LVLCYKLVGFCDADYAGDRIERKSTSGNCQFLGENLISCEGEKNHKKGGLNCVFGNFFFYILDNCPQVQSLK